MKSFIELCEDIDEACGKGHETKKEESCNCKDKDDCQCDDEDLEEAANLKKLKEVTSELLNDYAGASQVGVKQGSKGQKGIVPEKSASSFINVYKVGKAYVAASKYSKTSAWDWLVYKSEADLKADKSIGARAKDYPALLAQLKKAGA